MTNSPVPTLHEQVSAFAHDLRGYGFNNNIYNDAVNHLFEALARYEWAAVHKLLEMFKRNFRGEVSDQASMYMGLIENADVLVPA